MCLYHTPAQCLEHAHICVEASAVFISLLNVEVVVDNDAVQLQQSMKQVSAVLTDGVICDTHSHSHKQVSSARTTVTSSGSHRCGRFICARCRYT
jgi:plastocyanin domain-containing protein